VTKFSSNQVASKSGSSLKKFSGAWTGVMHHANTSKKEEVVLTIGSRFCGKQNAETVLVLHPDWLSDNHNNLQEIIHGH